MSDKEIAVKIANLEAQIQLVKSMARRKKKDNHGKKSGLRALKGILKGKAHFTEEEIEAAKVRFKGR